MLFRSGVKLNKRVRLIMGCNEETGSKCMEHYNKVAEELSCGFTPDANFPCIHGEKGHMSMMAYSKHTKIISMNGGFVSNAVCDSCTTVIPADIGLKEKLEAALADTKLQEYQVTEENGQIEIYAKGVPAHASTPALGINAAGVTFECLEKAGFEDDFVKFYNTHLGTSCDGAGVGLKCEDAYGNLTFCNGIVKTENGVISCSIDIRVPVTLQEADVRKMCEGKLEDENGRIEIEEIGDPLFFPRESPLVEALYKAYVDVTGDTEHKPMVIGGGTYAKSLKNIIAFGPEKLDIDYHIHSADEFILISEMEEAVLIYMEAIKNLNPLYEKVISDIKSVSEELIDTSNWKGDARDEFKDTYRIVEHYLEDDSEKISSISDMLKGFKDIYDAVDGDSAKKLYETVSDAVSGDKKNK